MADAIKAHANYEQIAHNMFNGEAKVNMSNKGLDAGDAWIMGAALEKNDTVTEVDVRSNHLDANVGQLFIPVVEKAHFESFCGIPVKQIRDNAITRVDMKDSELGPCGGVILAHCLKSNSSVTVVDVSSTYLGVEGGKALAESLQSNTTITQVC